MKIKKYNKGFTLLEILLVIAAIGILVAIVVVAINPNKQLAQSRNAERRLEINSIYKATEQYLINIGSYPTSITTIMQDICINGNTTNCVNLEVLVPDYIASIPIDPQGVAYKIGVNPYNNRLSVLAGNAELGQEIGINITKLWTPAQIGTSLTAWYDASKVSTFTTTANPFSSLIVIGDSWCENRVWPQVASEILNIPFNASNNFAIGGATVTGTGIQDGNGQIDAVIAAQGGSLNPNHLYAYFLNGNDLIINVPPSTIATQMKSQIQRLITAGARYIVIQNQKEWRMFVPAVRGNQYEYIDANSRELSRLTQIFVKELQFDNPDVVIIQHSNADMLASAAANPVAYNSTAALPNDPTGFFVGSDSLHMNENGYTEMGKWFANVSVTKLARASISQWNDSSVNSRNVNQTSANNRPTFIPQGGPQGLIPNDFTQSFMPSIRFDGDDFLQREYLGSRTGITAFAVYRRNKNFQSFKYTIAGEWYTGAAPGQNSWILTSGISQSLGEPDTIRPGGAIEIGSPSPLEQPYVRSSEQVLNNYVILGMRHDGNILQAWLNGVSLGTVGASGTINNLQSSPFYIGTLGLNTSYYGSPIDVSEIIILLSPYQNTQIIEGYLAHKWGLENNLPSNHPYRYLPPIMNLF